MKVVHLTLVVGHLPQRRRIPDIATEIALIAHLTTAIATVDGITDTVISMAASVVVMAVHLASAIEINGGN